MKNLLLPCCLFFLLTFPVAVSAQTLPGLDSTFADNGAYTNDNESMYKVLLQPDGKIITVGWSMLPGEGLIVKRFFQNGMVDNSFNIPNIPSTQTSTLSLLSACLQANGKIIFGGGGGIIRLQSNGSIDNSFGNNGYVSVNSYSGITGLAIQADGKVLAVGVDVDSFANDGVLITRFLPDGIIDSSFGNNGRILHRLGMYGCPTNDIALLPDGRIVIGVTPYLNEIQASAFAALRLLPDGNLDTTFNHTGIAWKQLPGLNYCTAMRLRPDGKILLAGYADSIAVVRFDTTGAVDNMFGNNGVANIDEGELGSILCLQLDGKILVAPKDDSSFVIRRIWSDGYIDTTFGTAGKIVTKVTQSTNIIHDIIVQDDGKIIAVGGGSDDVGGSFKSIMVRYTGNATGITNHNSPQRDILIYPNPAGEAIHIQNTTGYKITRTDIYSITGRKITAGTGNTLSVKNIAPGAYIAAIHLSNHTLIYRQFIIHH